VVDDPKLGRMSLRTMPLCVSTLTPFDPSPGNGPAVSSGIGVALAAAAAVVPPADVAAALDPAVAVLVPRPLWPHAASRPDSPTPANSCSARRRAMIVVRSNARPRSLIVDLVVLLGVSGHRPSPGRLPAAASMARLTPASVP
jgi:hypothetical protein